jgi:predicted dehydrogenase
MKNFYALSLVFSIAMLYCGYANAQTDLRVVRIAVAGTSHGHSGWVLGKKDSQDVIVTGIYERDKMLVDKQVQQFKLDRKLFYDDLNRMLDQLRPEAVVAFGSIYDHLQVVEACAPRGIHVMVEKPLAVSKEHAKRMESLAKKHNILLLTNYETSWYPATEKVLQLTADSNYTGGITKAVFHHGHEGPKEIGVGPEFLDWLTDPVQNGGGAVIDFGCYGANIMTALMGSTRPLSVFAVLRQYKPEIYSKVDDEATIVVEYPRSTAIIQASWNWPFGRKDMEVYGPDGYVVTYDGAHISRKNRSGAARRDSITVSETRVYTDPFKYLAHAVRKKITVPEFGLYSLSNNVRVVEILDAAKESASTGRKVVFKE